MSHRDTIPQPSRHPLSVPDTDPDPDAISLAFDTEPIRKAYAQGRLILFAGAGVSAGLGLPTFAQLVAEMARQLDIDPTQFQSYGEFRQLAEYYKIKKGSQALKAWMAREWHDPAIDVAGSPVHRLIAGGRFAHIYTTNYDRWLEAAHDAYPTPYTKIASADDLARAEDGVRQIVKLHGDLDNGAPIVLDESSYFERLSFETPLDIKLRADVLGKSVLFIGYSISDINIRLLFYKLSKIWAHYADPSARPPSYLFTHHANPVARDVLAQWGIQVLSVEDDHPDAGAALGRFMRELTRQDDAAEAKTDEDKEERALDPDTALSNDGFSRSPNTSMNSR
jgi:hypothetical protein